MRWQGARFRAALFVAAGLAAGAALGTARGDDTIGVDDPAGAAGQTAIPRPVARGAEASDQPMPGARGAQPLDQPVPATAVQGLLYARHFLLQEPYPYSFLAGQPAITRGLLLVLAVDPEVAKPHEVDVPVLYAGDTPVHLTNTGYPSGRLVVIVPGWFDPARAPVFFGSTELPERVDRARGKQEQMIAVGRGAEVFPSAERVAAFAAGGERLECRGSVELFLAVAELIDRYAPSESERADLYRTPLVEP